MQNDKFNSHCRLVRVVMLKSHINNLNAVHSMRDTFISDIQVDEKINTHSHTLTQPHTHTHTQEHT